jgi:trigger factor
MQSIVTRKNSYTIQVTVKESHAELEKARTSVLEEIRTKGKVKGFKQGSNIPDHVIIREFGESFIESQALDKLIGKIYPKILKKENIIPVAPGQITEVKSTNPVELIVEIETFPEIEIDMKKMEKIKIKKTIVEIGKDEVEAEITAIKKRFTHFHEAGHHAEDGADTSTLSVENGDRATISAQGYDKKGGEAIAETRVPNYPLVIGSGSFIPGFEENLIGAKVGDEVAFDITFPKDYHSDEFKGRKVHFIATIEKLEKPHTPEFTEDFIEKLRGKKTDLEGLKSILEGEIRNRKEMEARNKDENELMEKMLEVAVFEVGPELLKAEVEQVYREHAGNLEQQGYNIKQYLEHLKQSEESYKEEIVKPEAARRIKAELLLRKIREIQGTEPTEDEIKEEVEKIISQYGSSEVIERLRAKLIPGDAYYEDIKNRLAYRKVVDGFFA